jgi:flagellar basal body-associated protein FliL
MAEEEKKETEEAKEEVKEEPKEEPVEEKKEEPKQEAPKGPEEQESSVEKQAKGSSFKLLTWLILSGMVFAGVAGGFGLAQLLAGDSAKPETEDVQPDETPSFEELLATTSSDKKVWSFEIEPVIANLDEPGVTRYARVAITLELSGEMDQDKGATFMEEKKAILRDWLTTYIAGLSLERVRGTSNLTRIKKEIREQFNELLFPDTKPLIVNILFNEFAIQ